MAQTWRVARPPSDRKRPAPALDRAALERLALHYAGRYATTRAKLRAYLARKVRERGWDGQDAPPFEALVARFAELGYVDDRMFAESKGASLTRRGYGARRVGEALRAAGIEEEDAAPVRAAAEESGWQAALAFAAKRRIGPFAAEQADPDRRRRALAAMLRAGHAFGDARRIVEAAPGDVPDAD